MKEPPIPMEEIIRWCQANHPDFVEVMRAIEMTAATVPPHPAAEASRTLMSIAFTSGRAFQASPVNADTYLPQAKDPYS